MRIISIVFLACTTLTSLRGAVVVGVGYSNPISLNFAPGEIITFFIEGIGRDLPSGVSATTLPLPSSLAGISATLDFGVALKLQVPIISVYPLSSCPPGISTPRCGGSYTAVRVQIPFGPYLVLDPTSIFLGIYYGPDIQFFESGSLVTTINNVTMVSDKIHITSMKKSSGEPTGPFFPYKAGDTLVFYATGLKFPNNLVRSGESPTVPIEAPVSISFDWSPNNLGSKPTLTNARKPAFSGMIPGYAGLYQINVVLPEGPKDLYVCRQGETNLTINIAGNSSFDSKAICMRQ